MLLSILGLSEVHSLRRLASVFLVSLAGLGACAPVDEDFALDDEDGVIDEIRNPGQCKTPFNCKFPNPIVNGRQRNRIANRWDNLDRADREWPLRPGTVLFDGLGHPRGTVVSRTVEINAGQRKLIGGRRHVYAFRAVLNNSPGASGWVAESNVIGAIRRMPTYSARNPRRGDYRTVFTITGGNPAEFGDLRIRPGSDWRADEGNQAARDYLVRSGNVVNLLYAVPGAGGVSTDTFPVGTQFRRSRGVRSEWIYLYPPGSNTPARRMQFVYGHVGSRWGWIARKALRP